MIDVSLKNQTKRTLLERICTNLNRLNICMAKLPPFWKTQILYSILNFIVIKYNESVINTYPSFGHNYFIFNVAQFLTNNDKNINID